MASFVLKVYNAPGGDYRETVNVASLEEFTFQQLHEVILGSMPDIGRYCLTWEDPDKERFVLKNDKHLREAMDNLHRTQNGKLALKIHLSIPKDDENRFVDVKMEILDDDSPGRAIASSNQSGRGQSEASDLSVLAVVKTENLDEFPEDAIGGLEGSLSTDYLSESLVRTPVSFVQQQYNESLVAAMAERSNSMQADEPVASSSGSARRPKEAKGCDGFFYRKRNRKSGRRSLRRAKQGNSLPKKPSASGQKTGRPRSTKQAKKTTPSEESEHLNLSRLTRRAAKELAAQARAKQPTFAESTNSPDLSADRSEMKTVDDVSDDELKTTAAEELSREGETKSSAKHPTLAEENAEEKQPDQTSEESGEQELETRSLHKRHAADGVIAGGEDQRAPLKEPEEKRSRAEAISGSENVEDDDADEDELIRMITEVLPLQFQQVLDEFNTWRSRNDTRPIVAKPVLGPYLMDQLRLRCVEENLKHLSSLSLAKNLQSLPLEHLKEDASFSLYRHCLGIASLPACSSSAYSNVGAATTPHACSVAASAGLLMSKCKRMLMLQSPTDDGHCTATGLRQDCDVTATGLVCDEFVLKQVETAYQTATNRGADTGDFALKLMSFLEVVEERAPHKHQARLRACLRQGHVCTHLANALGAFALEDIAIFANAFVAELKRVANASQQAAETVVNFPKAALQALRLAFKTVHNHNRALIGRKHTAGGKSSSSKAKRVKRVKKEKSEALSGTNQGQLNDVD